MAIFPVSTSSPVKRPEFTRRPVPEYASVSGVSPSSPSPATTRRMGRPNLVANSKSRSSCPGTAMMAPVPYSIST